MTKVFKPSQSDFKYAFTTAMEAIHASQLHHNNQRSFSQGISRIVTDRMEVSLTLAITTGREGGME
ncbi:MAG TPA: hypothetical protein V6C90_08165 [Coleofasciculaceae cyanobacterium]